MEIHTATNQVYEIWGLLDQACDAIGRARDNELRQIGISRMQAWVLFIVKAINGKAINGPATPAQISRWLFREPNTVSALLDRMEKQGLVKKIKDLEKKNLIRVVITEKGEEAYQQSKEAKARGLPKAA